MARGLNILLTISTIGNGHPFTPRFYRDNWSKLKETFKFTNTLEFAANSFIGELDSQSPSKPILIGVHARRTDYSVYLRDHFKANLTSTAFFRDAMNKFKSELGKRVKLLMASDDPQWLKEHFGNRSDVVIVSGFRSSNVDPIGFDLAVLSKCHHSIFR